ncbi:MAG: phosphate/phosphite/phosphonate ABC transporter substrate-binding protein [Thaumarchaeota archaeon]|nr:phosphate/phosphite/phosphonate ABC transporter substrate-binding protein [Nitrososphaerota archaeon]
MLRVSKLSKLKLSLASPAYDRNSALLSGEVQPEGIELTYLTIAPQEAHSRMLKNQEFDVSDMSLSFYMIAKLTGKAPFTAIPVFPMRKFFHTDLVVNRESGIKKPSDMKGKKIGVPEYAMTLALWLRGIFLHEFGISPSEMEWFIERTPGNRVSDSIGFSPPSNISFHQIPAESDLMTMLESGEIDAAFPQFKFWKTFRDRSKMGDIRESGKVVRLFPNQKEESIRYFKKTGFFPINHTVVVRNEILQKHPWVAVNLFEAYQMSKEKSYQEMEARMREPTNYIWLDDLRREVREIFGEDPYPYGIRKNEQIIDAVTNYSYEQGLSPRKATPEDLFFPTTLGL